MPNPAAAAHPRRCPPAEQMARGGFSGASGSRSGYAQNGLREREARTVTVCLVKRKTSERKRLAYSAMTPSRSGMRTGTLLRPRRSPSTPARIGGSSPLAPALGWCSTTEGRAVLPGTPKPWPKTKTSLRTSPRIRQKNGQFTDPSDCG